MYHFWFALYAPLNTAHRGAICSHFIATGPSSEH